MHEIILVIAFGIIRSMFSVINKQSNKMFIKMINNTQYRFARIKFFANQFNYRYFKSVDRPIKKNVQR